MITVNRKRTVISFSLVAAILIAIYGSGIITRKKAEAGPSSAQGPKAPTVVRTIVLRPEALEQKIYATGTVLANEEIDLKNEIPGRVTALNFAEGRPVQKGALLVKINDADLRAELRKAELQVDLAEREEARAKKLKETQLLSAEQYDAIDNKLQMARADIQKIQSDLSKTDIRAPFSGIFGLRSISNGSTIGAATSIARIQQIDPVKIEFTVPEKYATQLHPGTQIRYTISGSDREYTGGVYAVEPKINVDTRTITVRALSRNSDRSLLPGAFAKIGITLSTISDALSIPTAAIMPELNGQKVYVYSGGKVVSKKIDIGMRSDSSIQVVSGLAAGDTIITTGLAQLRSGAAVTIANPGIASGTSGVTASTPSAASSSAR
jgi:membrane fusion protein (multidrug efflux system)